ncbi:MAG: DUF2059 domain-containing protein [Rhodanobacter sp.]
MSKWTVWGAALVLAVSAAPAVGATQPPSEDQVKQLMAVFSVDKVFSQMNTQMASVMSQQVPCVPTSYWQNYIDADGVKALMERMVPIYQRHFTADDVEGLLKFYRSPLGQKVITQMPQVMSEATLANQQWGQERAQQMLGQLEKDGKLDAQARCPAAPAVDAPLSKGKSGK